MKSIPYIFPVEPFEAKYLKFKTTKIKCETDFCVYNKNDYGSLIGAFKMDFQSVIKYLIESNGMPQRWLDLKLPKDCQDFVIFNVLVKKVYKEMFENPGKKLIYGHHFVIIFSLPEEDGKGLNYKKIKEIIESWIKQKHNPFSLLCHSKHLQSKDYNFPVQLITDFTQEFQVKFNQIQSIITETLSQPPYLIKISPSKERSPKSKQILIRAIQLLTTLFKIKDLITKNFPICAKNDKNNQHRILSAKMSTFAISKATTRLSNAIKFKNLHKAPAYISSIYSNMQIIQTRTKHKFEKYFDGTRKFPKLSFAEELLRSLKTVEETLKWNLIIFKNKWFFQWNESTKAKINLHKFGNDGIGIIVTKRNFPPETFYSHFNCGNLFWAIQNDISNISCDDATVISDGKDYGNETIPIDEITDNENCDRIEESNHVAEDYGIIPNHDIISSTSNINYANFFSEPLLYFNNTEQNFGIITFPSSNTVTTVSRYVSSGLLIDLCQCGDDKIRYWICESCHELIHRLTNDKIMCHCQRSDLSEIKKWCFQCSAKPRLPQITVDTVEKRSSPIVTFEESKSPTIPSKVSTFAESSPRSPTFQSTISIFMESKHPSTSKPPSRQISSSTTTTPMNTTKILIVQTKREKSCSSFLSRKNGNPSSTPSVARSQSSKATLAIPESDDDESGTTLNDDVFDDGK